MVTVAHNFLSVSSSINLKNETNLLDFKYSVLFLLLDPMDGHNLAGPRGRNTGPKRIALTGLRRE
jgi:hypothetical protein